MDAPTFWDRLGARLERTCARRTLLGLAILGLGLSSPDGSSDVVARRRKRKRRKGKPVARRTKRRTRQRRQVVKNPHWRPGTTIQVLDRTGPEWRQAVAEVITTWNTQLGGMYQLVHQVDAGAGVVTGAIAITSAHHNASWHGITSIDRDRRGYITSAAITLDEADYAGRFPWPETGARGALVCHELGHALGLEHTPAGTGGCLAEDRLQHGDPPTPSPYMIALLSSFATAA